MVKILKGKCMCQAVIYEVTDAFSYAMNCHCSLCRRSTGSAFKPIAGITIDHVKINAGQDKIMKHGDGVDHDLHCSQCGSLLYSVVRDGQYAHVPMGTLVDVPSIRPTSHIFVGSKAPWYEITDDLPQFDTFG